MKNISLNFFGEEVSINMPTDLASLRQQISEKFMFSPSDAAEIVVSYVKDLGKKIIQTEQDFVNFISEKINKIDLDISQDSQLYLKNFNNLQKETEESKNELEEALKKREEIKKRREAALKKRDEEIKKLEKQLNEIKNMKKNLQKISQKEKKQFCKEEKENNKKISALEKKLGINKEKKLRSRKDANIPNMIDTCLNAKFEQLKTLDKIPDMIIEKLSKCTKKILDFKLKQMHNFEKDLKKNKIQLKQEEKDFFMNYPKLCNDVYRRIFSFTQTIKIEMKKFVEDIQMVQKNQKQILCPLRKKLQEKENKKKEELRNLEVHYAVTCDGCQTAPIIGKRYKCEICPNFDFCEKCFEKEKENHKHSFKLVEKNNFFQNFLKQLERIRNRDGKPVHHGYICDGCNKGPIIGNRFKCTVCDDFDFCEACEEKFKDQHKHPFLKIYKPDMDPVSIKCVIPGMKNEKK